MTAATEVNNGNEVILFGEDTKRKVIEVIILEVWIRIPYWGE